MQSEAIAGIHEAILGECLVYCLIIRIYIDIEEWPLEFGFATHRK